MSVTYRRFDGERVSRPWERLLRDLRARGTRFHLNEGKRTFARQRELVRQKGVWTPSNPTGAAVPSHRAPHIRTGRFDHACDFDNAAAVETAAAARGVTLRATVPGEPWHLEADRDRLLSYYKRRRREIAAGKRRRALARAKKAAEKLRRRRTSVQGRNLIREYEGVRLEPYNDPVGYATIGIGHLIARRPVNQADRDKYRGFTRADADRLLTQDLKPFEKAVRKALRGTPFKSQRHFDSLVSVVFNLGPAVLDDGRSLGNALRSGSAPKVASAIRMYDKAGSPPRRLAGLTRRRNAEAQMFLTRN
jgi:GH24 family phage-related lysozyme (muramidase)